ncbi:hydrolase CocE/NonD family protein [Dermatophilus congolensis]|uniref:Hydrolase CocE/NonD family protein n=2 Tax=Dermatophilus congolensis TaxID=1863 RepID=A0A239VCC4_9MICO|nr:CocE/NonD family hydrolase [Dermatophilus congolensis]SNV19851.1 hydrolase CocE/NonD family protein [Dermatophilus congolensis]
MTPHTLTVPAHDGTPLHTIHIPADTTTQPARGIILLRTPYGAHHLIGEATTWAKAGLHAYAQDVRGRHNSGGIWQPYTHEGPDGTATLHTLTTRHPNLPILISGSSYGAHAAIEATRHTTATNGPTITGTIAMVPALGLWDTAHDPDGTPRIRDRIGWWTQHGHGPHSHPPLPPHTLDHLTRLATTGHLTDLFTNTPLDTPWRTLWAAPQPNPHTRWHPAHTPLLTIAGDHDFFTKDAHQLHQHWPGPSALIHGPWGHGLGTELDKNHPTRTALRTHGGLFTPILTWANTLLDPNTTPEHPHLHTTTHLHLDHGWQHSTPRTRSTP